MCQLEERNLGSFLVCRSQAGIMHTMSNNEFSVPAGAMPSGAPPTRAGACQMAAARVSDHIENRWRDSRWWRGPSWAAHKD